MQRKTKLGPEGLHIVSPCSVAMVPHKGHQARYKGLIFAPLTGRSLFSSMCSFWDPFNGRYLRDLTSFQTIGTIARKYFQTRTLRISPVLVTWNKLFRKGLDALPCTHLPDCRKGACKWRCILIDSTHNSERVSSFHYSLYSAIINMVLWMKDRGMVSGEIMPEKYWPLPMQLPALPLTNIGVISGMGLYLFLRSTLC